MKTIGVYLGEIYSAVAFKDTAVRIITTGPNNEELCRSCVAVDRSGNFLVGNAAYKRWKQYAPNIVTSIIHLMGAVFSDSEVQKMKADKNRYPFGISKMSGGTEESVVVILQGKEYTPEQISAQILRQLKEDAEVKLGDEITHAVITVPAYFNEKQKAATRKAAELAGLKVQCLLTEHAAAAISYNAIKKAADEEKTFLVYDFGDKSFGLSILISSDGHLIETGKGGDARLGGYDIDRLLSDYILDETSKANENINVRDIIKGLPDRKRTGFQGEFEKAVEDAKKALSKSEPFTVMVTDILEDEDGNLIDIEVEITEDKFERMIRPIVQRTLDLIDELLETTAFPIEAIDNILLVGGSSCIPLVRKMLSDKYGKVKILSSEKPMLAIAEGAAILSYSIGRESECPYCGKLIPAGFSQCPYCQQSFEQVQQITPENDEINVAHTTKHKYYIRTADGDDNNHYYLVVDENEMLPVESVWTISVPKPKLYVMKFHVFTDGESSKELLSSVYLLSSKGFPKDGSISIMFSVTADEIVLINAFQNESKRQIKVIMGRGGFDSHCCELLDRKSREYSKMINYLGLEKREKIKKIIEDIIKVHPSPESHKWTDYEQKLL